MRFSSAVLLLASAPLAFALPKITVPAPGGSIAAGKPFVITFVDDNAAPLLAAFTSYQILLFSGGDTPATQLQLANVVLAGTLFSAGSTVTGTAVGAGVGGAGTNNYFLGITATAAAGGTVTTFSGRFTITGMTGTFPAAIIAANSGTTVAAPPKIDQLASVVVPAAGAGTTDPAGWTIPYNLQTGAVKYAPMQPVPATAITATNTSPLWPTSSVVLASTFLPIPTIVTTYTQSGTVSVSSHANTAAAASSPVDDMQKFLNRWKD